ncbi:MAG TPA: hypothetical protein PLL30_03040 [Candidatus Krumholzibacteria bacterium]|nr:hypothetical protein [Candidatus Krumholzibacteria bacterium]HPD70747.1 hypothetical protein [Candidatus Krumholzibacteria bacterium]HRY39553.1 hypothetical protein [Candidatus Krumholzibacteria bacterium]
MTRPTGRGDPGPWNLDDGLIAAARAAAAARVAVYAHPGTAVVLGHGSDPDRETRADLVERDGVALLRRRGGGCAVVLDPGNLVCSIALPVPGLGGITRAFAALSDLVAGSLGDLGLAGVGRAGVSDLVLRDRKVGGSCIWRTKGLLYYSTTLLVDPDWDLIDRYLPHPPREPAYRRGRPHRDFLTSLVGAGLDGPPDRLAGRLRPRIEAGVAALAPIPG